MRSAQSAQNVHSNEQIRASAAAGGRSLSQHSQPGRNASMGWLLDEGVIVAERAALRKAPARAQRAAEAAAPADANSMRVARASRNGPSSQTLR